MDFEYFKPKLLVHPTFTSVWQMRKRCRMLMRNYAKKDTMKYGWKSVRTYCDYVEDYFERTGIPKW